MYLKFNSTQTLYLLSTVPIDKPWGANVCWVVCHIFMVVVVIVIASSSFTFLIIVISMSVYIIAYESHLVHDFKSESIYDDNKSFFNPVSLFEHYSLPIK
jgi:hypothetical protein